MFKKNERFFILFSIFLFIFLTPRVNRVLGESEVASRISEAEDFLEAAYHSLLEAEKHGGDISKLVAILNTALDYWSEAVRARDLGEYEKAYSLAAKAIETSKMVLETDVSLIYIAEHVEEVKFRNQLFLSFSTVCFSILLGFFGWRKFKDYYLQRIMRLRPEVVIDDS